MICNEVEANYNLQDSEENLNLKDLNSSIVRNETLLLLVQSFKVTKEDTKIDNVY